LFDDPVDEEAPPVVHDEPGVAIPVRTLDAEIRKDVARFFEPKDMMSIMMTMTQPLRMF
jgi:hypothetical protein